MAAFRQLSTHIVPPRRNVREARLNTHGQKFDPESLLWAYLIWNFAPILGQQISILDPPYIGLFGPSWSELSPYRWIAGGEGVGPRTRFFCHGQKCDYLSRASSQQCARGTTKNIIYGVLNFSFRCKFFFISCSSSISSVVCCIKGFSRCGDWCCIWSWSSDCREICPWRRQDCSLWLA